MLDGQAAQPINGIAAGASDNDSEKSSNCAGDSGGDRTRAIAGARHTRCDTASHGDADHASQRAVIGGSKSDARSVAERNPNKAFPPVHAPTSAEGVGGEQQRRRRKNS